MKKIVNFINNELDEQCNAWIDNYMPATGKVFSRIQRSNASNVEKAVEAASKAHDSWKKVPVEKRSKILHTIADLIDQSAEELTLAESIDNGKPISLSRKVDIPRAAANFRFFANIIVGQESKSHSMGSLAINYTLRESLGVVACISPWNLPLYLFTWKIAPAIASGNTVVAKPSEITPMTAFLLGKICRKAGLPPGVLNILHGYGNEVGEALVSHSLIKAVSFTGGTQTGRNIAQIIAPQFKKMSLELGGKNPNIIFADCAYEEMISTSIKSSFANQGQICLCGSRILVERSIYQQFIIDFTSKTKELVVGDPFDEKTDIGAIVSQQHYDKILSYIALAKEEGGTIISGGKTADVGNDFSNGYYIEPTIITGLDINARCNVEEIFGPVVTITPFDTEEEAIQMANNVPYGLSASIWTNDIKRSQRVAQKVEAGIIWINTWLLRDLRTPFGGMKDSGYGREGGYEALNFFTEQKNICIKIS